MVVAVVVTVFGSVALNAMAAEESFAAQTLSSEVRELELRSEELTVQIARLSSPERIRDVATNQLGMVPAEQPGHLGVDRRASTEVADARGTMRPNADQKAALP